MQWQILCTFTKDIMFATFHTQNTVMAKRFRTPRVFPLNPIVNKPCKIKRSGNEMHQIVQNMILT